MPKKAERAFKKAAKARHLRPGTKRYNAYVYGGMEHRGLLASKRRSVALKRRSVAVK